MAHDRMDCLCLVEPFLAFDDVLGGDSPLGKIDVAYLSGRHLVGRTFLLIDPQYDDHFVAPDSDELVDTPDPPSRQLAEQNHSLDIVVFQQLDICAHLCDLAHLDNDELIDCRELILVEPAVAERAHAVQKSCRR